LTALASLILYPDLVDKESGYIKMIMDPNVFPTYLRGFMLAAFAAAYMSTVGTQLNWGASYVMNDFYRRFVKKDAAERHYVLMSQVVTVLLMIVSIVVTFYMESIGGAWKLLLVTGAGTGLVLLLRWFWWRINAWSEVSSMIMAAACSLFLQLYLKWDSDSPRDFAYIMLVTLAVTSLTWVAVTLLTPAEPMEKLISFYLRVRPDGPGWNHVRLRAGAAEQGLDGGLTIQFVNWILGCVLIYAFLFGLGELLLGAMIKGVIYIAIGIIAWVVISKNLKRTGWRAPVDGMAQPAKLVDRSQVV
jgi:Na+/proline symporter